MIHLGLIGPSHKGLLHLGNTRFFNDVEVVAVPDKSQKRLDETRSYDIARTHKDYKDLRKRNCLEAVAVTLPSCVCVTYQQEKMCFGRTTSPGHAYLTQETQGEMAIKNHCNCLDSWRSYN